MSLNSSHLQIATKDYMIREKDKFLKMTQELRKTITIYPLQNFSVVKGVQLVFSSKYFENLLSIGKQLSSLYK